MFDEYDFSIVANAQRAFTLLMQNYAKTQSIKQSQAVL